MTDPSAVAAVASAPNRPRRSARSSLKARIRIYSALGIVIVGGWLYYTVNAVSGLYDATVQIARYTELRERVTDAIGSLREASDSLDRYSREGQGYDLSQHYASRTELKASLAAIRRQSLTEGTSGKLRRAEAAENVYSSAAEQTIRARAARPPGKASRSATTGRCRRGTFSGRRSASSRATSPAARPSGSFSSGAPGTRRRRPSWSSRR